MIWNCCQKMISSQLYLLFLYLKIIKSDIIKRSEHKIAFNCMKICLNKNFIYSICYQSTLYKDMMQVISSFEAKKSYNIEKLTFHIELGHNIQFLVENMLYCIKFYVTYIKASYYILTRVSNFMNLNVNFYDL